MPYKIDPDVLHKVAKQVVGLPLENGELVTRAIQLLADEYPDLIDPTPGRWVGSKAGGILGKVRFLYFSPREYIVIFGTPTGTQGFSGRYKHVQIHKFLMAGQIDSYDVESDDTTAADAAARRTRLHGEGPRQGPDHSPRLVAHRVRPWRGRHHAAVRDGGHAAGVAGSRIRPPLDGRVHQAGHQAVSPLVVRSRIGVVTGAITKKTATPANHSPF